MSAKLEYTCVDKENCKFSSTCIAVLKIEDGGYFSPILKIRLEKLKLVIKCQSFQPKEDKNDERGKGRIFQV